MKLTSFLNFFKFTKDKHPSLLQNAKYLKYASELIVQDRYQDLLDMTEKGYQLTPRQIQSLNEFVGLQMFNQKFILIAGRDLTSFNSALELCKNNLNPHCFLDSFWPSSDHIEAIFFSLRMDLKFFYVNGINYLEKTSNSNSDLYPLGYQIIDNPSNKSLQNGIDIIAGAFSYFLNDIKKNKKRIEFLISALPTEIIPLLVQKENRLTSFINNENTTSNFSIYVNKILNLQINEGKKIQDLPPQEQATITNLKFFQNEAQNFISKFSKELQSNSNIHKEILSELDSNIKATINESNFVISDLSKIFNIPTEKYKKVSFIQALYGKLILQKDLSIEDIQFIEATPKNILNILSNYDMSKDLIHSEALHFLDSLDIISEKLATINLTLEEIKINNLTQNNKKQIMVAKK